MIRFILNRAFQAKVQAELFAQCNNQEFVNFLCHRDHAMQFITQCRTDMYFSGSKIAPFMTVICLLAVAIEDKYTPMDYKEKAVELLFHRLAKTDANPVFKEIHERILVNAKNAANEWRQANPERLPHLR